MKALKENPIENIFDVELFMLNHKLRKQAPHHKMTLPFMTSFKLQTRNFLYWIYNFSSKHMHLYWHFLSFVFSSCSLA
jgi:hypothetical protein